MASLSQEFAPVLFQAPRFHKGRGGFPYQVPRGCARDNGIAFQRFRRCADGALVVRYSPVTSSEWRRDALCRHPEGGRLACQAFDGGRRVKTSSARRVRASCRRSGHDVLVLAERQTCYDHRPQMKAARPWRARSPRWGRGGERSRWRRWTARTVSERCIGAKKRQCAAVVPPSPGAPGCSSWASSSRPVRRRRRRLPRQNSGASSSRSYPSRN